MYILAIETTGPHCSAALIDEHGNVTEKRSEGTLNHLQNLVPMIQELLIDCKLQIDDTAAIAVSCGPGSFTGIRIGVSTARALSQAAGKPALAVPTLKSFAYHLRSAECSGMALAECEANGAGKGCSSGASEKCVSENSECASDGRLRIAVPIFDARRNQVYGGAYMWRCIDNEKCGLVRGGLEESASGACCLAGSTAGKAEEAACGVDIYDDFGIAEVVRGGAYMLDEFLALLADTIGVDCGLAGAEVIFYGDGCEKYGEAVLEFCRAHGIDAKLCGETQKASSVARLALDMYNAGELLEYGQLHPDYMRKAEAERKLEEKRRAEAEARGAKA